MIENKRWNTRLRKGRMLKMNFNGYKMKAGEASPTATVMFERKKEGEVGWTSRLLEYPSCFPTLY